MCSPPDRDFERCDRERAAEPCGWAAAGLLVQLRTDIFLGRLDRLGLLLLGAPGDPRSRADIFGDGWTGWVCCSWALQVIPGAGPTYAGDGATTTPCGAGVAAAFGGSAAMLSDWAYAETVAPASRLRLRTADLTRVDMGPPF